MTVTSIPALSDIPFVGSSIPTRPTAQGAQAAGTPDFSSVLADMAKQTASTIRTSEDMAIKGMQGQVPVQEVVQAVIQAQTSLQTALAVRDKVVSTYQSLTQMQI
jgi:flagellar hook-basal body complex protein FliE